MSRAIALPLLLAACGVGGTGQKVTVLLTDRTVTCEAQDDGTSVGHLTLDQADDLYLAEFVNQTDHVVLALESHRDGLDVRFACPDGIDQFTVRHATVLQARTADEGSLDVPPGGGNAAPTAF